MHSRTLEKNVKLLPHCLMALSRKKRICRNCLMQLLPSAECITMAARPQSYSHSSEPEPGLIVQPLRAGDVTQHSSQHWCPSQTRVSAAILSLGAVLSPCFWANQQQQASQLPHSKPLLQGIAPIFLLHRHTSSGTATESCGVAGPAGSPAACTAGSAHMEAARDVPAEGIRGTSVTRVVSHKAALKAF